MKSRTSKFFAWIIVVLLVLGLAGFGIQDVLSSAGRQEIARVGDQSISPETYIRTVQQEINNFSQRFGSKLTFEQASTLGLPQRALQTLTTLAVIDQTASDLGISRGDTALLNSIETNSDFYDFSGAFSRENYEYILQNSNLLPDEYEDILRREMSRNLLLSISNTEIKVSETSINKILNFINEKRSIDIIKLTANDLTETVNRPADIEILDFYNANKDDFRQPLTKNISYLMLTPEMLKPDIEVTESELKVVFTEREPEFFQPEQREIEQLTFLKETTALEEMNSIQVNKDRFNQIIKERDLTGKDISLGLITSDDLPTELSDRLFSKPDIGVYGPYQTELGFNIYNIKSIIAESKESFEDVKDSLKDEIQTKKSLEIINSLTNSIQDDLAGGSSLEELADQNKMKIGTLRSYSGATLPKFAESKIFQDALNEADLYESDLYTLDDGGILSVRLDSEEQPYIKDLSIVEEEIIKILDSQKKNKALVALAKVLISKLNSNERISELPEIAVYEVTKNKELKRFQSNLEMPSDLVNEVFKLNTYELATSADGENLYIAQLLNVELPSLDTAENMLLATQINKQFYESINQDILGSLIQGLRNSYNVSVNNSTIDRINSSFE